MAKLSTLIDSFTGGTINTATWGSITGGAATLDTVNDQVVVAQPTVNGTANTFGSMALLDATNSSIYAQVTPVPNGNGGTRTTFKLTLDANNSVAMRVQAGAFVLTLQTGGTTVTTTLAAYDAHAHRWWRLRESGGSWNADVAADGLNWSTLFTTSYSWAATALTFAFQTAATVTEVAGNSAVLAHVNTRVGGAANPNWPTVEHGVGLAWGANAASSPLDLYVDVSGRTGGQTDVSRGRQYETDQVKAGTESSTLANPLGDLDPTSATSPFAGLMQPFQPYRIRAQWPPAPNLLTRGIASGGSWGGAAVGTITASAALDLLSDTDTTGGSVVTSASAWIGGTVAQFAVPNATAAGQRIVHSAQVAVVPGQPYTLQLRVRDVTASTTLQVKAALGWVTAGSSTPSSSTYGSTVTLTGGTAPGWSTLTVSGTAPANAIGIDVGVAVAATAGALCSVQSDGWQLEHGLTASAWVIPGAWHPMASMFTEDWASQWTMSGTYGTVSPPSSDAFSLLSQQTLQDPLTMEINSHSPRFLFALADPSDATMAADTIGAYPPAPVLNAKTGAGTWAFGTDITAATPSGVYTGSTGTVAGITNSNPGTNTTSAASFLSLTASGIKGPATVTYSRTVAFRYTGPTPTFAADIWCALDNNHGNNPGSMLRLFVNSSGGVGAITQSFTTGAIRLDSAASVMDGNWHLASFGFSIGGSGAFFLSLDGVYLSTAASSPFFPNGLIADSIGAFVDPVVGNSAKFTFSGAISFAAEFPVLLSAPDCTNLYTAWRSACAGESTDARYARILRYGGYAGPTSIQTGLTTSMGPAATDGTDVVSALEDVVTTENGSHYVARDGTPTFKSRGSRYNATVPSVIFGERDDLGEWPYEDTQAVWDSTHLGNKITVTQSSTGQQFYAKDNASITAYFPRTMSRTVNTSSALEAQDAANYLKSRYKNPLSRITTLVLHPAANPAMWATCLGLELGTRARVMRRPPGVTASQFEVFVENITWSLDNGANAVLTLQCSPADTTLYATFAAWHTTLTSGIASGVSTITVNASADTVNPLALQLAHGQSLALGQNTANQETVTISAVGATSPGWTTATIALAAATTKSHASGDIVCEPLPAGITDPTTWDQASRFDFTAFAY